jgi:MarR family transcriptional regulator, organic hydroperoxide resistance regulator
MGERPVPPDATPGETAQRAAALVAVSRAAYSLSAADARLRGRATRVPGALSLTHARALRVLAEGGPYSIRELATLAETTSAAATQLVNGLAAAGYVKREPDPGDRRAVLVSLTPRGRARHEERERTLAAALEASFGHLSPGDLAVAADVLHRLASVYDDL